MAVTVVNDDVGIEDASQSAPRPQRPSATPVLLPLGGWLALIAATVVWGRHLLDQGVGLGIGAAPLAGRFEWRISIDAFIPVAFGAGVVCAGPWIAARIAWPRLLVVASVLSGLWA